MFRLSGTAGSSGDNERSMERVTIVGAGFGGLRAARALAGKSFDVVLVDRHNYHLFHPLLYQVAAAELEPEEIVYPIRSIIRKWRNVRFLLGEARGLELDHHRLLTDSGALEYDYLILATGSVTNYFYLETPRRNAYDLKELGDAVLLRNQVLTAFERAARETSPAVRSALMTFVIVGGGPTGIEFAGALSELVRHALAKDYPELNIEMTKIVLIEASDRLLQAFPTKLQQYALDRLRYIGVDVMLGRKVTQVEEDRIVFKDGSSIPTCTVLWVAGVQGSPLVESSFLPLDRTNRIKVNPDLTLEGHPEIFVIGDLAAVEGQAALLPMVAPVAMQQGEYVGKSIIKRKMGHRVKPFAYFDRGTMITIGRGKAAASIFGFRLIGFPAWIIWLCLHLFYLIGFRNRVIVTLDWAYDYFLFARQMRLIMEGRPARGGPGLLQQTSGSCTKGEAGT